MNKTVKGMVVAVMVSVLAGSSVFAAAKAPAKKGETTKIERTLAKDSLKTICGKVKVHKDGYISLRTKDGTAYAVSVSTDDPKADKEIFNAIKCRDGKQIILSGEQNKNTHIFTVFKIGGFDSDKDAK